MYRVAQFQKGATENALKLQNVLRLGGKPRIFSFKRGAVDNSATAAPSLISQQSTFRKKMRN